MGKAADTPRATQLLVSGPAAMQVLVRVLFPLGQAAKQGSFEKRHRILLDSAASTYYVKSIDDGKRGGFCVRICEL